MLFDAITIETVLTSTQVVSYTYTDLYDLTNGAMDQVQTQPPFGYSTHLMLNWYKQPNTTYTVTIGSNVADAYGNTLPEDYILSFTTGDYPPLLQIDLDRFTHYTAYTNTVVGVKLSQRRDDQCEALPPPAERSLPTGGRESVVGVGQLRRARPGAESAVGARLHARR